MNQEEIIYGIYDNTRLGVWRQLNDFLIDHSRVSLKEKSYFFYLLAVMVDSGVPLVQSLRIVARRTTSERLRRVLFTVAHDVEKGKNFADTLSRFPDVFEEFEIGVIRSGEASGHLDKMLSRLATEVEDAYDLQSQLWSAAFYPLVVVAVLLVVGIGVMTFLVPKILQFSQDLSSGDRPLPAATQLLITTQYIISSYWWLMILAAVATYGLWNFYVKSGEGKIQWDLLVLKLPIIGMLRRKIYVLRIIRLLAILLESGLPILVTLKMVAQSVPNEVYRLRLWDALNQVQQGGKLHTAFQQDPFLFPEEVTSMLAIGEQSATISQSATRAAFQYEKEIKHTLKKLTTIFEPALIIIAGIFVAVMAIAVLMPIFDLTSQI
jgi:type II secretory pathway component PulF